MPLGTKHTQIHDKHRLHPSSKEQPEAVAEITESNQNLSNTRRIQTDEPTKNSPNDRHRYSLVRTMADISSDTTATAVPAADIVHMRQGRRRGEEEEQVGEEDAATAAPMECIISDKGNETGTILIN